MRINNYSYSYKLPKLTLKINIIYVCAFHDSYAVYTGPWPGSIIIRCKINIELYESARTHPLNYVPEH